MSRRAELRGLDCTWIQGFIVKAEVMGLQVCPAVQRAARLGWSCLRSIWQWDSMQDARALTQPTAQRKEKWRLGQRFCVHQETMGFVLKSWKTFLCSGKALYPGISGLDALDFTTRAAGDGRKWLHEQKCAQSHRPRLTFHSHPHLDIETFFPDSKISHSDWWSRQDGKHKISILISTLGSGWNLE